MTSQTQTETISDVDSIGITSSRIRMILSTDSGRVFRLHSNGTLDEYITDRWSPIDPGSVYFAWMGDAAMKALNMFGKWVYTKFKSNLPEFVRLQTPRNKNKFQ